MCALKRWAKTSFDPTNKIVDHCRHKTKFERCDLRKTKIIFASVRRTSKSMKRKKIIEYFFNLCVVWPTKLKVASKSKGAKKAKANALKKNRLKIQRLLSILRFFDCPNFNNFCSSHGRNFTLTRVQSYFS